MNRIATAERIASVTARRRPGLSRHDLPGGEPLGPATWVPTAVVASVTQAMARIGASPSIGITSLSRRAGRTTIAAAAAVALSYELEFRTVVVDLDLGRPGLHEVTRRPLGPGMADYLAGNVELADCLHWENEKLAVVTAGSMAGDRLPSLAQVRGALAAIGEHADVVIADLPPLPPHGQGAQLALHCATTVLVMRAGRTPQEELRRGVRTLGRTPAVVINRAERAPRWR